VCVLAREEGFEVEPGITSTVWTARRVVGDHCADIGYEPEANPLVILDLDGDGSADAFAEAPCPDGCDPSPAGATDLNGDGVNEIIVAMQPFSIMDYQVFVLTPERTLTVAEVSGEGHIEADFEAGKAAVFSSGGDEGNAASVRCENWPGPDTGIIQTTSFHAVDTPEPTQIHVTTLQLQGTAFVVVDRRDDEVAEAPPGLHTQAPACGFDWYLNG
jgi:hypothetical protein